MGRDGLKRCEAAFERLRSGRPTISSHVGLDREKITAGIVSVEAGFDRGYLKKSRSSHQPLLALIEAYRKSRGSEGAASAQKVKRVQSKLEAVQEELRIAKSQLQAVVTQNLQLVERVAELELALKKTSGVVAIKTS